MAEVRIIIDPGREGRPGASDVVVASAHDCLLARARLRETKAGDAPLTIWVRSDALAGSFDDLRADPLVEVECYDLRHELAAVLGVAGIPELVTPEVIRECDLLAVARRVRPHEGESVLAWCYRVLLGDAWARPTASRDDVPAVVEALVSRERPHLRDLVVWRLTAWAGTSTERDLWSWLADDPFARARCLMACLAVRGYGNVAMQWLTQAGIGAEQVREAMALAEHLGDVGPVRWDALPPVVQDQVRRELSARLGKDGVDAVEAAQGCSETELRVVLDYLRSRAGDGELLSAEESQVLITWSSGCPGQAVAQQVEMAATLLTKASPPAPLSEAADWGQAARWVEVEYMPAYLACAVADRLEETAQVVARFEDWLCGSYRSLMEGTHAGLQYFCAGRQHIAESALVVLVLLDGVPLPGVRWLRDELAEVTGASIDSEGLFLAPVPSLTSVGKSVLLSARLPDQAEPDALQALAETFGVEPEACRAADRLQNLGIPFPGQVVFHHYKGVDEHLLHKPMTALERWLQCHTVLMELAGELKSLLRTALDADVPLWLGCASDHGWTELPKSAPRVDIPEELAAAENHRRVITGTADSAYGIALPASGFFLHEDYTVARGYGYFARRPHGAVHGGLTPQEVAVYGMWLTTAPVAATADLILHVAGEIRRAVDRNRATLQLNNPNADAAVVSAVELDTVTPVPGQLPLAIEPMGVADLPVICDASGCTDMLSVVGSISWQTSTGRRHTQAVDFSVPTTGAATTDRDFEDMFKV